jgi:hypothetical protein
MENFKQWLNLQETGTTVAAVSGGVSSTTTVDIAPFRNRVGAVLTKRKNRGNADGDEFKSCGLGGCLRKS